MNPPSAYFSAKLYELANEIFRNEGCVTFSADDVSAAARRIDGQTRCISALRNVLEAAYKRIATDRRCLFECHIDPKTGRVEDELGKRGLAEYDEILGRIADMMKASA